MDLIRKARMEDLPELSNLFNGYRQFYEQASDLTVATAFIGARLKNGDATILVAQKPDHTLAGFCQMYPSFCSVLAAPIYVLYDLFVAPSTRRSGVGRALLNAAAALAADEKKARLDLTTAKTNLQAQALYESLGWQKDQVFLSYSFSLSN